MVEVRKNLEVSLSESSRKFITCIRKYILFYLNLLENTGDLWTVERAYVYLQTDKRVYIDIYSCKMHADRFVISISYFSECHMKES